MDVPMFCFSCVFTLVIAIVLLVSNERKNV